MSSREVTVPNGKHVLVDDADGGVSYKFIPVTGFKGGSTEFIYQGVYDTSGRGSSATINVYIAEVTAPEVEVPVTPPTEVPEVPVVIPVPEVPAPEVPETPTPEVPENETPVEVPTPEDSTTSRGSYDTTECCWNTRAGRGRGSR